MLYLLLFLCQLSVRSVYDPHTVWSLSGIGVRIAHRIGLQKDGSHLGLSVFETEMRRRLWWQIIFLDAVFGQISGIAVPLIGFWDICLPMNLNDSDLDPEMKEIPVQNARPTEMLFCLLRYEFGHWLFQQSKRHPLTADSDWGPIGSSRISKEEKGAMIDELEKIVEEKYVRFCDPAVALHQLTFIVARSMIAMMRLHAFHPRLYDEGAEPPSQAEKDFLFDLCITVAENIRNFQMNGKIKKFLWHGNYHFQWTALIYLLTELRQRTIGEGPAKAWDLIDFICTYQYQEMGARANSPLHIAIANLALKAWAAHTAECERRLSPPIREPKMISVFWMLAHQRDPQVSGSSVWTTSPMSRVGNQEIMLHQNAGQDGYGEYSHGSLDQEPLAGPNNNAAVGNFSGMIFTDERLLDWNLWDELLQLDEQQNMQGIQPTY